MKLAIAILTFSFAAPVLAPTMPKLGCSVLAHQDVDSVPHGFFVHSLQAFFHTEDAVPSGDDRFWICISPEGPLALYVPVEPPLDDEEGDQ